MIKYDRVAFDAYKLNVSQYLLQYRLKIKKKKKDQGETESYRHMPD